MPSASFAKAPSQGAIPALRWKPFHLALFATEGWEVGSWRVGKLGGWERGRLGGWETGSWEAGVSRLGGFEAGRVEAWRPQGPDKKASDGRATSNAPDLFRPSTSSGEEPGQCKGGGPFVKLGGSEVGKFGGGEVGGWEVGRQGGSKAGRQRDGATCWVPKYRGEAGRQRQGKKGGGGGRQQASGDLWRRVNTHRCQ